MIMLELIYSDALKMERNLPPNHSVIIVQKGLQVFGPTSLNPLKNFSSV